MVKTAKNKAVQKTKKKLGRPAKQVDWKMLEQLVCMFCTLEEVCSVLDITQDILNAKIKAKYGVTFLRYSKMFSGKGKLSLRRKQFKLADTNATMAIFLGKNYLDQTDKTELGGEININIVEPDGIKLEDI